MKMLTVTAFLCAMIALSRAAALGPPIETAKSHLVKRSASCSGGWSEFNGRCFRFIPKGMTWAKAEKNCQTMGGNLASIHDIEEYHEIQRMIKSATYEQNQAWVGGSDAQQEGLWMWSDGTQFTYTNWCRGEPNNLQRNQNCLQINHTGEKCWDDYQCDTAKPSVCAKKI